MSDFGVITLQIDGKNISVKGGVTFNNLSLGEKTSEANMDGTIHTTFTPMVATAEIESLSACSIPLEELARLIRRCDENGDGISAIFGLSGSCSAKVQTIHFVRASLEGSINFDGATGEISGFQIASGNVNINGINVRSGANE